MALTEDDDAHGEVRLRLPSQLKKLIKVAAAQNERSLNAEVVARLERSFSGADADRQQAAQLLTEALALLDKGRRRARD